MVYSVLIKPPKVKNGSARYSSMTYDLPPAADLNYSNSSAMDRGSTLRGSRTSLLGKPAPGVPAAKGN